MPRTRTPATRSTSMPLAGALLILLVVPATVAGAVPDREATASHGHRAPIVIGHRGASGYRPEHTLASYQLAIDMGADYIEPDLVSTKDGVLVARHENDISGTTDVASHPEFAGRKATKTIDGLPVTGWFTEDFTLAELRTLRAKERLPDLRRTNTAFDGLYQIPTLDEVIALAKRRKVGIYPETKHPTYFDSVGLSLEEPLVAALRRAGLDRPRSAVFIQSFEVGNLRQLNGLTRVPLVQLLDATGKPYDFTVSGDPRTYADLATPEGLAEIATYADGVGVNKNLIVPRDAQNRLGQPTGLVRDAHQAGLIVHGWTFRRENSFLPEDFRAGNPASDVYLAATGDFPAELRLFYGLGVDGVFSDNPDVAVAVRTERFGGR
ncbi:MAG TPA: glycerophosphodiester phosphodiesterase [Actinomycetota bacterium]|nr:glycerophosphodiester phosphodiesterase [Actinomycetota bacterium]